jgi:hypothetical protein
MRIKIVYPKDAHEKQHSDVWVDIAEGTGVDEMIEFLKHSVNGPKLPEKDDKGRTIEWIITREFGQFDILRGQLLEPDATFSIRNAKSRSGIVQVPPPD